MDISGGEISKQNQRSQNYATDLMSGKKRIETNLHTESLPFFHVKVMKKIFTYC